MEDQQKVALFEQMPIPRAVMNLAVPTVLSSIVKLFSDLEINVENLINKSKKELAYTMIDIDRKVGDSMIEAIEGLDNIIRVRILK